MALLHDVQLFADPWEHVRMLSDAGRNAALLGLLKRRAPGARVLEVGSGSGLWAIAAAKLGAREVWAVEPTPLANDLRALAERTGLADRIRVIEASLEELDPEPMDLVFSELLNADPFAEGLLETSEVARAWVSPGGHLGPRRLQILAQPALAPEVLDEVERAQQQVRAIAAQLGVDVEPLAQMLRPAHAEMGLGDRHQLVGPPQVVWDLELGLDVEPEPVTRVLEAEQAANAAVVWFRAELDEDLWMHNAPGTSNHWGQLVARFGQSRSALALHFEVDDASLEVVLDD